jgi:hypothetical protein
MTPSMFISQMEAPGNLLHSRWRGGGLHFLDTAKDQKSLHQKESVKAGVIMVNTVEQNKTRYSVHYIKRAEHARKTQDLIGRPSTSKY